MDKKKLYQLYERLTQTLGAESEEAGMLKDILIADDNSTPKGGIKLTDYIDNKSYAPVMRGVYYDGGNIVASDTRILIAVTNQSYPAELEGKVIDKDGEEIGDKYPNWRAIFPSDESKMTELKPDWGAAESGLAEAKFAFKTKTAARPRVDFGPFKLYFRYAEKLLGLRRNPGISRILYTDDKHAVLVTGPNYRLVVMPVTD